MDLSGLALLLVGWLLGILSPGAIDAIARTKRRTRLAAIFHLELVDLRFRAALVLMRVRSKLQTFDQPLLEVVRPLLLGHTEDPADAQYLASLRPALSQGDTQFIEFYNTSARSSGYPYPVPYEAPILEAHLAELTLFSLDMQRRLIRVRDELAMYNQQVAIVRARQDLTMSGSLSADNHEVNRGNLMHSLHLLSVRAQALVTAISALYPTQ